MGRGRGVFERLFEILTHGRCNLDQNAGTSPSEDWADSVTCYRFSPDTLKTAAPGKYKLIQEKIYQGREYTQSTLQTYYDEQILLEVKKSIPDVLDRCLVQNKTVVPGPASEALPLSGLEILGAAKKNCVQRLLGRKIKESIQKFKETEWEACDFFAQAGIEQNIRKNLTSTIQPDINQMIQESDGLGPKGKAILQIRKDLQEKLDPKDLYRKCYLPEDGTQIQTCYLKSLTQAFAEITRPYQETAQDLLQTEWEGYVKDNSFDKVAEQTTALLRNIFPRALERSQTAAAERWKTCESAPEINPGTTVAVTPFTGRGLYVDPGILQCINQKAEEDLDRLRSEMSAELSLPEMDRVSIQMTRDQIFFPPYNDMLQKSLEEKIASEKARWTQNGNAIEQKIKEKVAALDPVWLISAEPLQTCMDTALAAQSISDLIWNSRFLRLKDQLSDLTTPLCKAVLDPWLTAWKSLERAISARGRMLGGQCKSQATQQQRQNCVTTAWERIENLALIDWKRIPAAAPYLANEAKLVQPAIQQNRKRLQGVVFSEMEQR